MKAGARADANVALTWLGTGTLVLTDWPQGAVLTVTDADQPQTVQAPGAIAVTTGHVVVEIQAPTGQRRLELDLASGARTEVAVKAQLPGTIVLAGLPAGSSLRLMEGPTGASLSSPAVPREAVARQEQGVGLAGPVSLTGLLPGAYVVHVNHPVLGDAELRLSPTPGEQTDQAVLWQSFSGAAAVQTARADWERRQAASRQMPKQSKLALASAGASAVLAGTAAIFGARALSARTAMRKADGLYESALAVDDDAAAWVHYATAMERQDALRLQGAVSLGGLGLTAAGAGVAITFALKGHAARGAVEDWDLYALPNRPVPAPAANPYE